MVDTLDAAWLEQLADPRAPRQARGADRAGRRARRRVRPDHVASPRRSGSSATSAACCATSSTSPTSTAAQDGVFQAGTLYLDARALHLCVPVADAAKHARARGRVRRVPRLLRHHPQRRDAADRGRAHQRRRRQRVRRPQRHVLRPRRQRLGRDDHQDHRQPDQHPRGVLVAVQEAGQGRSRTTSQARGRGRRRVDGQGRGRGQGRRSPSPTQPLRRRPAAPPPRPPRPAQEDRPRHGRRDRRRDRRHRHAGRRAARARCSGSASGCRSASSRILLMISGPSMLLAWLKLRRRNLGPILDANGWAINGRARINVAFGAAMTELREAAQGQPRARSTIRSPTSGRRGSAGCSSIVILRPRRHLVRRQARRLPARAGPVDPGARRPRPGGQAGQGSGRGSEGGHSRARPRGGSRTCAGPLARTLRGLTAEAGAARKAPCHCGSNSVVECNLAKVDVEGSNPFSRSIETTMTPGC